MKPYLLLALACLPLAQVSASPYVVADFDDIPVGTTWQIWGVYGSTGSSTATVALDPANAQNHVLHIRLNDWNTFPEFQLPDDCRGTALTARYKALRFDYYRSRSETDGNKQMHIYYGSEQLYADQSYPWQGDAGVWQQRSYNLDGIPALSQATQLRFGIHHAASDYYIDNVVLVGELDDYEVVEGGVLDLCVKNSSSSYTSYSRTTLIPEGQELTIRTSRYTDLMAPLAGSGTLHLYAGGERTYIANHSDKKYPDWSHFTGQAHIYPYTEVEKGAGFYGIVMGTNGKTFSPENVEACLNEGKVCTTFANSKVTLHDGAAIAFENGTRAARFGHLSTTADSRIYGYYKAQAGTGSYLLVGSQPTDGLLAGRIAPIEQNGSPLATSLLGIIKEGANSTYRLTNNRNCLSGGLRVLEGRMEVDNDAAEAEAQHLPGGTGTPAGNTPVAYVMQNAFLGGTGNIAGTVDVYGTIDPGDNDLGGIGTLCICNYATPTLRPALRMHPASRVYINVMSATRYDQLLVAGDIEFSQQCQDFGTSDERPIVRISLDPKHELQVGDELTILTAANRKDADLWQWHISLPSHLTWTISERYSDDSGYALMLTVTSLDDDPTNAGNDERDEPSLPSGNGDNDDTTYADTGDPLSLREYADMATMHLGVATPASIAFEDERDPRTSLVATHFNMLVPENELKWDATEPAQGQYAYDNAERMVTFAERHQMYMRGHTLVWHSQLPQWISVDGKKNNRAWTRQELMDILQRHITQVVGHFKGRIHEWDVVNECLDDDQSIVRNNPEGYRLRQQSIWTTVCGEAFIDSAFVWAHRTDPEARLILNDYDNETQGKAKTQAFYNLARRLKQSGIPIDGVGLQCHLDAGQVNADAIERNIARYAELGLSVTVTELDLGIHTRSEDDLQQQARDYRRIIEACARQPHCRAVLIWGLTDDMSWRSSHPLLWDRNTQPKPAFHAVKEGLRTATSGIDAVWADDCDPEHHATGNHSAIQYYDLMGRPISPTATPHGLLLIRKLR